MNERAAEALYDAERKGVRQIQGYARSADGGRCAVGVLMDAVALGQLTLSDIGEVSAEGCPLCGNLGGYMDIRLAAHLNDDHGLTFSEIARKLGPDSL